MPRVWMLLVKLVVLVGKGAMIGTVLAAAVKSFFVSTLMLLSLILMDRPMLLMIASVGVDFVIIMSEGGGDHKCQRQSTGRESKFTHVCYLSV